MMTARDTLLHAKWSRDNALEEAAKVCEQPGKRLGDADSYWGPEYAKRIRALKSEPQGESK